jgi:lactate dehydrogenase-like 2-hydroxyacid dehydrogenase
MAKVFITRQFPGKALEDLKAKHDVEIYEAPEGEKIPRDVLLEKVKGVDAILSLLTEKIDAEVMDTAGPQLKVVANYAVGFDNIDVEAAKERNIWVTNTPSDLGDAVAEFTVALMLALSRRIVEADKFTRAGRYKIWSADIFLGQDLTGKTLGVIGAGTIGSVVAKRAKSVFDMQVLYTGRSRKEDFEAEIGGATFVEQDDLIKQSDVITTHVPLTPATRHMIAADQFAMMKPTAIVINTSRGPVIQEAALVDALEQNKIWGAALDVYEEEVKDEVPNLDPADWQMLIHSDRVILTPHIASATIEAREEMTAMAVTNVIQALESKEPPYLVPGYKEE